MPKLWNAEEEKMLIHIRLAKDLAFNSSKSHEVLWNDITRELNRNGINISRVQVINKWKALKKYKEVIDSNKKTGNDRVGNSLIASTRPTDTRHLLNLHSPWTLLKRAPRMTRVKLK